MSREELNPRLCRKAATYQAKYLSRIFSHSSSSTNPSMTSRTTNTWKMTQESLPRFFISSVRNRTTILATGSAFLASRQRPFCERFEEETPNLCKSLKVRMFESRGDELGQHILALLACHASIIVRNLSVCNSDTVSDVFNTTSHATRFVRL